MPPISIKNLASDSTIQPPKPIRKRGRPKSTRIYKGAKSQSQRKCIKCGESGHNTRICLRLGNRAGRGERARQWRQEQEDWELDIIMEDQEVEAQVRREVGGGDSSDSDSELSQLRSSDFEGMEV